MQTNEARTLASQFATVDELIEFIRHLDQRDDLGDPRDGPRLTCDVTQRLRLPALDPNCFERLALFLALALLIDPTLDLTSATMMLDNGLHSFPVRLDGDKPRARRTGQVHRAHGHRPPDAIGAPQQERSAVTQAASTTPTGEPS